MAASATLQYDTDIFTNYVQNPQDPLGPPQVIQSYNINLQCLDANSIPMANASLLVQSSASTIVNMNGKTVMLSVSPVRYTLDVTGEMGIIAPATGLSSPSYTFSHLKDQHGNNVNIPVTTIDPSRKALAQFENIKTGAQLKSVPGRAGTTLYANATAPADTDLDTAAKAFQDLASAAKGMPSTPTNVQAALNAIAKVPLPNDGWPSNDVQLPANALADPQGALTSASAQQALLAQEKLQQGQAELVHKLTDGVIKTEQGANQSSTSAHTTTDSKLPAVAKEHVSEKLSIRGAFSDLGHDIKNGADKGISGLESGAKDLAGTVQKTADGVEHQVKKAEDPAGWLFDKAKDQWSYAIKLADQAWTFIIEKMDDIGPAFDKVWQEIKLGWKELEMWVGFLFDWEGIIATAKMVESSLSATLDFFTTEARGAKGIFKDALQAISEHAKAPSVPSSSNTKASAVINQKIAGTQSNQSAADKWFSHQAKHGGIMDIQQSQTATQPAQSSNPTSDQPGDHSSDDLNSTVDSVSTVLSKLANDITTLFGSSFDLSVSKALSHFTDSVVQTVTDGFKVLMEEIIKLIADLGDLLKKAGEAVIKVPILSWIFREISGQDLTLFNFVSLCISIPSTFLYRACKKGKRLVINPVTAADLQPGSQAPQTTSNSTEAKLVIHTSVKEEVKDAPSTPPPPPPASAQSQPESSDFAVSCIVAGGITFKLAFSACSALDRDMEGAPSRIKGVSGPLVLAAIKLVVAGLMIVAETFSKDLPSPRLRYALPCVLATGGLFNCGVIFNQVFFVSGANPLIRMGKMSSEIYRICDMVNSTVCFILGTAIFAEEMETPKSKWAGKNDDASVAQEFAYLFAWANDMAAAMADANWDLARAPQGPPLVPDNSTWAAPRALTAVQNEGGGQAAGATARRLDILAIALGFGYMGALWAKAGIVSEKGDDFAALGF